MGNSNNLTTLWVGLPEMKAKPFCIKAVLLDFDGILIGGGPISFDQAAHGKELIHFLRTKNLKIGIISAKSIQSIERELEPINSISNADFDLILSKDNPVKSERGIDSVLFAANELNVTVEELLLVGDSTYYSRMRNSPGAVTILLDQANGYTPAKANIDYRISNIEQLKKIVRLGLPLHAGKLPNDLLQEFLDQFSFQDPSVLINPGVGEDTTAVDVVGKEVLVLKSDPITYVTDSIGHYAVLINANDMVTSGAIPRWFLTVLLLPCGIAASAIRHIMFDLYKMCKQWDITLCGGHTEITDAVSRPVVTGMLAGTVAKSDLIDKNNMERGDKLLMTKAMAVEGTAIIAAECGHRLKNLGFSESEIEECKQFLNSLSILEEANIASRSKCVSALHDVTEGGLATAIEELSIAGRHKIRIHIDRISLFTYTERICRLLDINPLGLIGSGSLLICCRKGKSKSLMKKIHSSGIEVVCIGEVLEKGKGIEAINRLGIQEAWPNFEVDEITRFI